ncbi:MAG: hypothetical protein WKG07_24720 [Hymenobacter sp.]
MKILLTGSNGLLGPEARGPAARYARMWKLVATARGSNRLAELLPRPALRTARCDGCGPGAAGAGQPSALPTSSTPPP